MLNSLKSHCSQRTFGGIDSCFVERANAAYTLSLRICIPSTFAHPRQGFCWCWLALTQIPELCVAELCKSCTSIEILCIQLLASESISTDDLSQSAFPSLLVKTFFFSNFEQLGFWIGALQSLLSCLFSLEYECKSSALHIERTWSSMRGVNWIGDIQFTKYKCKPTWVNFMSASHSLKVILTQKQWDI